MRSCNLPAHLKLKRYCLPTVSSCNHGIICFLYHLIHKLRVLYCHCNLDCTCPGVCSLKQNANVLLFCKIIFAGSIPLPAPKCKTQWRRYIIQSHLGEESILSHAYKAVGFILKCISVFRMNIIALVNDNGFISENQQQGGCCFNLILHNAFMQIQYASVFIFLVCVCAALEWFQAAVRYPRSAVFKMIPWCALSSMYFLCAWSGSPRYGQK